jgi:DNA-binding NtrC family response regulator
MAQGPLRVPPARRSLVPTERRPPCAAGSSVLILDPEPAMRSFMQRGLARQFALVETAAGVSEAEELLRRCHFDLLITDIGVPGGGLEWVEALSATGHPQDVIFVAADALPQSTTAALRAGARDFLLKPFRIEQLMAAARRSAEQHRLQPETASPRREIDQGHTIEGLVGTCEAIRELGRVIHRVAPMPSTILIQGESGTGKELAARAIHRRSGRPGGFVAINCGAVSPELLESELFGHVKGAFTGAHQTREGLFRYAHGGSLFLDEIGEMPLGMQAKLLRVLEEKTIRPVGGNEQVPVDVRIIAATNRTLSDDVAAGRFREDLYYRLNVVALRLPPLRERGEDLITLARFFLGQLSTQLGVPAPEWDPWELEQLNAYDWPGNVRELRNVVERSLLLGLRPGSCIAEGQAAGATPRDTACGLTLAAVEQAHILRVLALAEGNKSDAARRLGISRKTLERKLKAWAGEAEPRDA